MSEQEHPSVAGDICRATYIGPTGIEWICVRKPHAKIYRRRTSSHRHRRGAPIFSNNPGVDQHFWVNRWPNRKKEDSTESDLLGKS